MLKGVCFLMAILMHVAIVRCRGSPPHMPAECKAAKTRGTPPHVCCSAGIFKDEDLESCGFDKSRVGGPHGRGSEGEEPSGPRPDESHGGHRCTKQLCVLKMYNLMKDNDTVDKDAVGKFLDGFASKKPDFKFAAADAKVKCLKDHLEGPPGKCEADGMMHCINTVMFVNCPAPVWKDSESCSELKRLVEMCSPFFKHEEAVAKD